jgi:hypothetical protein
MMFLANTLARSAAIFELRRVQYDSDHNLLDLNPPGRIQTKKFRPIVPVTPFLKPWLNLNPNMEADDRYITYRGRPVKTVRGAWDSLRTLSGIDDVCAYSFRHGMAREMRKRKVPMEQIEYVLGHLPSGAAKTTSIYAPFEPEYCGEAQHAIQSVMMEVQSLAGISYMSNPAQAVSHFDEVKPTNVGKLSLEQIRVRDELILKGVPGVKIAAQLGVSSTAIYKAKKKRHGDH